jgi:hypothetical protein
MRRFTREDWDGRKTLVVRRSFKGAGRTFAPGDAFEWKRYGVEPRRVRQLYEAGFLDHEDAPVFTAQPGAKRWSIQRRGLRLRRHPWQSSKSWPSPSKRPNKSPNKRLTTSTD